MQIRWLHIWPQKERHLSKLYLTPILVLWDQQNPRYDWICRPTPILENHIRRCHGNHAFSHSLFQFILRTTSFRIQGVPINNFAPMKNCSGVHGNLIWMPEYIVLAPKRRVRRYVTEPSLLIQTKYISRWKLMSKTRYQAPLDGYSHA